MASKSTANPLFVLTVPVTDKMLKNIYFDERLSEYFASEVLDKGDYAIELTAQDHKTIYEHFIGSSPLLKRLETRLKLNLTEAVSELISEMEGIDYLTGGTKSFKALFKLLNIAERAEKSKEAEKHEAEKYKKTSREAAIAELKALGYTVTPPAKGAKAA